MKKFLSVVLTGALLLSLAACAKTVPADVTGSVSKASVSAETSTASASVVESNEDNTAVTDNTEANNAVADNTEADNTAADNTAASGEAFSIGEVSSDVYENEFFNVKVTPTGDYRFLSDSEIEALGQATAARLADSAENVSNAIENGSVLTPMYVSDSLGLNSLGLTVSYIGLAGALVSDADIIDATLEQVSTILTSNGFENVTVERGTTTFLGEEVACMIAHATIQGIDMYEKQVEIIKDGYMASFTATTFMEDGTDAFLGMITELK